MLMLARNGAEEGLWLRAERQTGGRGRQGRVWTSPEGNLYASTVVRLRPSDPQAATLALVAAIALEEVVRAYHPLGTLLKWPNDLLLGGAKLSGILLERADDAVVIGIGVNLAHHPENLDRPATSLAAHGVAPDPADFLETLATAFTRWLAIWRIDGLDARPPPLARSRPLSRWRPRFTARLPDGSAIDGLFAGLDEDGALILRLADGTSRVIHAADVFLI